MKLRCSAHRLDKIDIDRFAQEAFVIEIKPQLRLLVASVPKADNGHATECRYFGYAVRTFRPFPKDYIPADIILCGYLLEDGYASYDVNRLSEQYADLVILIVTASVDDAKTCSSLQKFPVLDELYAATILKKNQQDLVENVT